MKKAIILQVFFICQVFFGQIKMELKILDQKEVYENKYGIDDNQKEYLLEIKLINEGIEDYIIPIDTMGYRAYFSGNKCEDFFMLENYPDAGFTPMVNSGTVFLEASTILPTFDETEFPKMDKEKKRREDDLLFNWRIDA